MFGDCFVTHEEQLYLAQRIQDGWPRCETCEMMIPLSRLEVLPLTTTCAEHSKEGRYIGVPLYTHKTAATVAMVKADPDADDGLGEAVHQLMRGYHRRR
jgi:hypothetical protein